MIDTHAHLDFSEYDRDREEVISRFFEAGGRAIINIGVDLKSSMKSIEIAEKHENIFATVGVHPHDAQESQNSDLRENIEKLKKMALHEKVVACGEIGLDYSRIKNQKQIENQKNLFSQQLNIARELRLPVVIHCRDAWEDVYGIIRNHESVTENFVLHCYSGDLEVTKKLLKLSNIYFSFSGNITYPKPKEKSERISEIIRLIPLDKIMLDSDSPYLAPQEKRGQRNEPINVFYIAKRIAVIKDLDISKVEKATDKNAQNFFGI